MTVDSNSEHRRAVRSTGFSTVALLYAARTARGLGDGFAAIVLPAYLVALGYSPFQVGVVATGALLGTAILTLGVGWLGSSRSSRVLLLVGATVAEGSRKQIA